MITGRVREIRDQLRRSPQEIQLCCPDKHFIADVELVASDDDTGTLVEPILMLPSGPRKPDAVARQTGAYGFWVLLEPSLYAGGSKTVQLACTHHRCHYRGVRNYARLAFDLASAALAGDSKYRLTS